MDRKTDKSSAPEPASSTGAGAMLTGCGPAPAGRREPPAALLLSAWAGIIATVCGVFCSAGPWLFQNTDLSAAIWVTGIAAIALGVYAAVGAYFGIGRGDLAAAGIVLGAAGIILTFVWTPGPLFLTPT